MTGQKFSDATDQLWKILSTVLVQAGLSVPKSLDRIRAMPDIWLDPNLVLAQTCGFPYLNKLQNSTTLLGTPDYTVDGASDGHYQSLLMTHRSKAALPFEEFTGTTLAINGVDSQSGFNAVRLYLDQNTGSSRVSDSKNAAAAPAYFFRRTLHTGSHRASLHAVASEQAALCAIDPVSLALAHRYDAQVVEQLCEIDRTPRVPALPLICSNHIATQINIESLRLALRSSMETLPEEVRQTLHFARPEVTR